MNVFQTHSQIIKDYSSYVSNFINISDPAIREKVDYELENRKLWPEPLLQFNPAFEMAGKVSDLANTGVIHPAIADIFKGYSLYQHQVKAIELGTKGKDFIVTSGTGSGKSLTYIGSIFHYLLSNPGAKGGTAVVVYPMNALINSQFEEFNKYKEKYEKSTGEIFPITFGQYTGQEKEKTRENMRENPPHVLLTNYMMLELLLTRTRETRIRDAIYSELKFLVFDELHTYRGRQGADVAMLIRRIRSQAKNEITCIGTSATMVSAGTPEAQRKQVAMVATTLFGKQFEPDQIINEKLTRSLETDGSIPSKEFLAESMSKPVPDELEVEFLKKHPVAIWIENRIALEEKEGNLLRRRPLDFRSIVSLLSLDSGIEEPRCRTFLEEMLQWISKINKKLQDANVRYTYLPFKLHQFISQTGSVYTTLDQDENRFITLEPGVYQKESEIKKPIYPNVFSRESGHAFICVAKHGNYLEPREFKEYSEDEDDSVDDGYLIFGADVWNPEVDLEYLPDAWMKITKSGRVPDSKKKARFPVRLYFDETGRCSETEKLKWWGWFMTAPLLFDPTSGSFFDAQTSEGTKLTKLGSEGRSTAATITTFSILNRLNDAQYSAKDQKLLSFTDNRQDAALQAGHFNDFVQTIRFRAGIWRALKDSPTKTLSFANISEAVFNSLNLPFTEFANRNDEAPMPHIRKEYENLFQDFLFYRIISDLRRSWRIILPNLEQCALLEIGYAHLNSVAANNDHWKDLELLNVLSVEDRTEFIRAVLDFFRLEYALHSENYFNSSKLQENEKLFCEKLLAPWTLDQNEHLREPSFLRIDALNKKTAKLYTKSMGSVSALGKFIKNYIQLNKIEVNLKGDNYNSFIIRLMKKLEAADYIVSRTAKNTENEEVPIYRLRIERIIWQLGDGQTVRPDIVKRRGYKEKNPRPNSYFRDMYQRDFSVTKKLRAEDHTGQLNNDTRKDREDKFRADWYLDDEKKIPDENRIRTKSISVLFCSPTMELGVDIGGLSVVHMRNVPPNAANYAQRSGRAGRSGQGALVFTFCSSYAPHDRHYFNSPTDLVAGTVQAPRLDLCNKELLLTHLHAFVVSEIGMPAMEGEKTTGRTSLMNFVEQGNDKFPLDKAVVAGLEISSQKLAELKFSYKRVLYDFENELVQKAGHWYNEQWIEQNINKIVDALDGSLNRWRTLFNSAKNVLSVATQRLDSGTLKLGSDEYKKHKRSLDQATRQLDLLRNDIGGSSELSEFYPYRYLASEGFLPGYNFTRLPIRIFLPTTATGGEFVSRPRSIALREFGPLNIIYHNGRKYRVSQLITQELETSLKDIKISKRAGYVLADEQTSLENCPFTGLSLSDTHNKETVHDLAEMSESRAEERERITCEEEERLSKGFEIRTYFTIDGGSLDRVKKATVHTGEGSLLNLRFIQSARLVDVSIQWRANKHEGYPIGIISGDWRSSIPEPTENQKENYKLVKLWTSRLADTLFIEPIQPLGLLPDGVITLQHALKRAIESVFQVESNEIGVTTIGDPEAPNILIYEAAEGSLGILSRFVENIGEFHAVIEKAIELCRFDDQVYKGPATYDDLLSYYNQRDHKVIDRHLIKSALEKLRISKLEIQTNSSYSNYEEQYQSLLRNLDPNSTTERKFIDYLYENGLRLPDSAQKKVEGLYVQPDFYYNNRFWVFCDGTPHDQADVIADDSKKRQAIIARGDEVWVYYYKDNLAAKIAERPDIFKKVK